MPPPGRGRYQAQPRGRCGNDLLLGSPSDDVVAGSQGNHVILMGGGTDVVLWNRGGGSDTIEGQASSD